MKIIECPRDAMQGIETYIPVQQKANYINQLLKVGFDTVDFGSYVSPKAIPQMKDTDEVLDKLDLSETETKLLAIVANKRGAETAVEREKITYLGFPLSVSETFQKRNTNKSIGESFGEVEQIQELCVNKGKKLVVYLSMGFGNPYGDPFSEGLLIEFTEKLTENDITIISLADTIGTSNSDQISRVFRTLIDEFPGVEFGAHLHSPPQKSQEKVRAVIRAGCSRIDGALLGIGGCPMAEDKLTGNIDSQIILNLVDELVDIDGAELARARKAAHSIFK